MKILVFEWLVGGGVSDQHPLDEVTQEFLIQGRQMLSAVCEDFLKLGHQLIVAVDCHQRFELTQGFQRIDIQNRQQIQNGLHDAAAKADAILLIAPESDSCLEIVSSALEPWKEKLISPNAEFVCWATNKWSCHRFLSDVGINCPRTTLFRDGTPLDRAVFNSMSGALVVKPVDGAGSEGIRVIDKKSVTDLTVPPGQFVIQDFVPGMAVSVSAIVSPNGETLYLEPLQQVFKQQPIGAFSHSKSIDDFDIVSRAKKLAMKTVAVIPPTRGHVGIDMVISNSSSTKDCVIEINPRLTTSYTFQSNALRLMAAQLMAKLILE